MLSIMNSDQSHNCSKQNCQQNNIKQPAATCIVRVCSGNSKEGVYIIHVSYPSRVRALITAERMTRLGL